VSVDRAYTDVQDIGYLLIGGASSYQSQHFHFALVKPAGYGFQ
jgi:hypothetical protein